jgi:hypothetical protein
MHIHLKASFFEDLPFHGRISPTGWLMTRSPKGNWSFADVEITNHYSGRWSKTKAKNAKAKHRKRYNR